MKDLAKLINKRFDAQDERISLIELDLKEHVLRSKQNERQMGFLQWVFPICMTILGVSITLAVYFKG